ncbi:MAG: CRISPR-associated endonuclease Cas1 [Candidatus Korarchaeum sp.]|nr:CRISPR-associated endonuclease Cas1 [Candidatus Korarchaeum sp.]MDW8035685.1 CRISPR-associated endonuclease Cas1 [Candidatus Korarchaeum sp.]
MKKISISSYGVFLGARGGRLVVRRGGETLSEVPAFEVSQVLIDTRGASISTAAMLLLLKQGAEVLLFSNGRLVGKLAPTRKGANVLLRIKQYEMRNSEEGLELAKAFVLGKMRNQADMLKSLAKNREEPIRSELKRASIELEMKVALARDQRGPPEALRRSLMGIEAETGKIYWSSLARVLPQDLGFTSRKKRYEEPKDPFNVILNYLYSLLMSEAWFSLDSIGLDPFLGFLHAPSNRRPALAADLMEEFRQPVVDRIALGLVNDAAKISKDSFLTDEGRKILMKAYEDRMRTMVTFRGRKLSIRTQMRLQAERLASAIMGRGKYEPFRVRW